MPDCECMAGCPFYNEKMDNMPSMTKAYKRRYCMGDYFHCARYSVYDALGRGNVPTDLYPNEVQRAKELIAQG